MVRAVESKPSQIKARRLIKQQLKRDLEPETVDELDEEEGISVRGGPLNLIKRARLSLPAPSTSLSASSNIRSRRQTSILPLRNIEPVPSRNVNVNIRQWRKSMLSGPPPDLEKRQEIVRVLANIALEALLTVGKVDEQGHVIKFDGPRVAHWKSFVGKLNPFPFIPKQKPINLTFCYFFSRIAYKLVGKPTSLAFQATTFSMRRLYQLMVTC
jgi:hypothetical protein